MAGVQGDIERILRTKNLYDILGVESNCTEDQMSRAYKKLALKLHPDKCREPRAEDAFKCVSKAYDTLKNGRERYDRFGDESGSTAAANPFQGMRGDAGFVSPEDLFAEMFGPGFSGATFHTNFGGPRRGGGGGQQRTRAHFQQRQQQQPQPVNLFSLIPSPMTLIFILSAVATILPLLYMLFPYLIVFLFMNVMFSAAR